jgi:histone H3/H4
MENITKISIKRLSKCAGVKTISDDCYDLIRDIIENKVKDVVENSCVIMNEDKNSKTLSHLYVYQALELSTKENILKIES